MAQLNLALLFGQESQLPFYYRKLPGNITDVKTVKNLLADLDYLGYQKVHMVMDRGFYSEDNVNGLFRDHIKLYEKYFDVKSTPIRGTKVTARQEAIDEAKKNLYSLLGVNQPT